MPRGDAPSAMTEDDLLARWFRPLATAPGAFQLMDDIARLPPWDGTGWDASDRDLPKCVVTVDTLVAGVHFFSDDPPEEIAAKSIRVTLSDLAASAARPFGYLLALSLPSALDVAWVAAFVESLRADQERFGLALLGGDTVRTPGALTISTTGFGQPGPGPLPIRSNAQVGDHLFVTGPVGDATLGLALRRADAVMEKAVGDSRDSTVQEDKWVASLRRSCTAGEIRNLVRRHRRPRPRLDLVEPLRSYARAAMDVSDGLLLDLERFCRASKTSLTMEMSTVPLSPTAERITTGACLSHNLALLTGGDDYELLVAVPPESSESFAAIIAPDGGRRLGKLTGWHGPDMEPVRLLHNGEPVALKCARGFRHEFLHHERMHRY